MSIAGILASEGNDVTLVDENKEDLTEHQERYDIRTVIGHPPYPDVLQRADAENADLLVALMENDECNLVACQVAQTLFHIPTKIARLEASTYIQNKPLFESDAFPVDNIISPQKLVAENIALLVSHPGTTQASEFVSGHLLLIATVVAPAAPANNTPLDELRQLLPDIDFGIAAVYRGDRRLSQDKGISLQANDEVYCVTARENAKQLIALLAGEQQKNKNVFIAGGGNCGMHLANLLNNAGFLVKLMERNPERASFLAKTLDSKVIVLRADATAENVLLEEGIEESDVYCAVTSDDEDNIMSAMLAKNCGVKHIMALVGRMSYIKLVEKMVDVAISPQEYSIGPLLRQVRESDIVSVCPLRHSTAEMIEVVAHGDSGSSRVVGKLVGDVRWPQAMRVVAIARGDEVIMARPDTLMKQDDRILLFIDGQHRIGEVEKLFRISATFL